MKKILALLASLIICLSSSSCVMSSPLKCVSVSFDLNYSGATGAPPTQLILKGSLVKAVSDPSRTGYAFRGWYSDKACLSAWDFQKKTADSDMTLYAGWISTSPPPAGQVYSIEFGHTTGKLDFCAPMAAPSGGTLFSVWTKDPKVLSPSGVNGLVRGNMIVYSMAGDNWSLVALVGNVYEYAGKGASYNANYMLDVGNGDYVVYQTLERDVMPFSVVNDWVWVAWQVIVNSNGTITLRQWLKFGLNGPVFAAGPYDPTYTTMSGEETVSVGYKLSEARTFQVGYDNSWSNDWHVPNSYLVHARLQARSTKPSLAELDAIARATAPDPNAWGDWELNWVDGAPNLTDRSGNGHNLTVASGGTLYQGPLSPSF